MIKNISYLIVALVLVAVTIININAMIQMNKSVEVQSAPISQELHEQLVEIAKSNANKGVRVEVPLYLGDN